MGQGVVVDSWAEAVLRYSELDRISAVETKAGYTVAGISSNQATMIRQAEAYVHGRLSPAYSVPFSNDNLTAKNLVIDAIFVQNCRMKAQKLVNDVSKALEMSLDDLLTGKMQMVSINGAIIQTAVGEPVYSNTSGYHPVFGMGDETVQAIDSQQLIDENNARGWPFDEAI